MQQDRTGQGERPSDRDLQNAAAENEDAIADASTDTGDDREFSDEHPLASPGELAGTADQAIAAEIAALGPEDDSLADSSDEDPDSLMGDAIGSSAGMDIGQGTRPDPRGDSRS